MMNKDMTKTEIRKAAGIGTSVLAKMGKGESTAKKDFVEIETALNCGGDDIAETSKGQTFFYADTKKYGVSDATIRNWKKLNTLSTERLTTRANKRQSKKRVIPMEYLTDKENNFFIQNILDYLDENNIDIMSAVFSLGINLLKKNKIYEKPHVINVLNEYANIAIIHELLIGDLPTNEFDFLGLIYQSYLQEGKKNIIGSYYTPQKIAYNMTNDFDFSNGESFFDPCCGSGAFLMTVATNDPNQIFGVDNDQVAVLIAKINMLLKYRDIEFVPQIYCLNFLMGNSLIQHHPIFEKKFDYIATNHPWGAMDDYSCTDFITSKETFSFFFVKAYDQLNQKGTIRFLFPEAILNVKIHKDIRNFIINQAGLVSITTYDSLFSSVTTKFVDIECGKGADKERFNV